MANGFNRHRLEINGARNPCWKCAKRTMTCHANCKDYADYQVECAENRRKRWMKTDVDHAVTLAVNRCKDK